MGVRGTSGGAGGTNPNSPFLLSGTNIIYDPIAAAVVKLILGASVNALAPVNQTLTVQNATPAVAVDTAGASLTIASGAGTGTGAGSTLTFQTPTLTGAGTGAQTLTTRALMSAALGVRVIGGSGAGFINTGSFVIYDAIAGTTPYLLLGINNNVDIQGLSTMGIQWSSSAANAFTGAPDLFLTRRGAANLQLGQADAAAPVAQILTAQGSRAGTDNNVSGGDLTIQSGRGTGTGTPSSIFFQVPITVGAGNGAQTFTTMMTITAGTTTGYVQVNGAQLVLPAGTSAVPGVQFGQAFGSASQEGIFRRANAVLNIALQGTDEYEFSQSYFLIPSDQGIGWSSTTSPSGSTDLFLTRGAAAAVLQLGAAASVSPVAQTLQAQGSRGGTDSDVGGGNLTIQSGAGTGIGAISSLVFKTPTLGTTGTTQQVQTTRMTIDQNRVVLGNRLNMAKGADVAAANDLTLGVDGNVFVITGNTQINAITTANWAAGSVIILIFSGTPTVKNNTAGGGGTAKIFLALSADLVAAANTVLQLVYDGTQWQEVSRKVA